MFTKIVIFVFCMKVGPILTYLPTEEHGQEQVTVPKDELDREDVMKPTQRLESSLKEEVMKLTQRLEISLKEEVMLLTQRLESTVDEKVMLLTQRVLKLEGSKKRVDKNLKTIVDTQEKQDSKLTDLADNDKNHDARLTSLNNTDRKHDTTLTSLTDTDKLHNARLISLTDIDEKHNTRLRKLDFKVDESVTRLNNLEAADKNHDTRLNELYAKDIKQDNQLGNLEKTQLNSLKIVKSPVAYNRSQTCAFTCVGSTGRADTVWKGNDGIPGYIYTYVDMSKCGFADTPVITVSVEGSGTGMHQYMAGSSAVVYATSTRFFVELRGFIQTSAYTWRDTFTPSTTTAKDELWNVMWSAYGFKSNC